MAESNSVSHSQVLVWSPTASRGDVRKWRLHACGCARMKYPRRASKKWLAYLEVAESHADGRATNQELKQARDRMRELRPRGLASIRGDFDLALYDSDSLERVWRNVVIEARNMYSPDDEEYDRVLERFRVLEDLIGPETRPIFDPMWRGDTTTAIARGMYESREFSAMPILADALQDEGCEDAELLDHCRDPRLSHFRGCWVVDLVLFPPATRTGSRKSRKRRDP